VGSTGVTSRDITNRHRMCGVRPGPLEPHARPADGGGVAGVLLAGSFAPPCGEAHAGRLGFTA
jgi:hypothetical protein